MNTLALDLATITGWAAHVDGRVKHGVVDFRNPAENGFGALGYHFHAWASDMIRANGAERVLLARNFRPRGINGDRLAGMTMVAHTAAYTHDAKVFEYPDNVVRKALMGRSPRRTEAKLMVMEWCREQGFDPADDNAADAIALLTYGMEQ